jgi:hypothetical protein
MALSKRKKRWLIGLSLAAMAFMGAVLITASVLSRRFEPFIREQAVQYLSKRFDSEVDLAALRIHMPRMSPLKLWRSHGHGSIARVEGEGISMRFEGNRSLPPLFSIGKFSFEVDLGSLWEQKPVVSSVLLDKMEIHVPPKGERPRLTANSQPQNQGNDGPKVKITDVVIRNARLVLLPKDKTKVPLDFDIQKLRLEASAESSAMKYDATLTNPKPPGLIQSKGSFGPWVASEPSDTALDGKYVFGNADLGVFRGIAGILQSNGEFGGTLSSINAKGEAYVPDFRLKSAGRAVPLRTKFEVLVDGTNGNTVLQPVHATLGSTQFTTSGAIIKHEGDKRRSINLDVSMPRGQMRDLLRLATKAAPIMEGQVALKTKVVLPPLTGKVKEKLQLDGRFDVTGGKFLRSTIQEQIDSLSRRAQGQPKNEEIDEVVSHMKGRFKLDDEVLTFHSLAFGVPGANIEMAGRYDLDSDQVDFHGTVKLDAKVSQTMSGWKRWALKPVDPFFAKEGAGTFLRVKVDGTSKDPNFGLDRRKKEERQDTSRARANK